MELHDSLSDTLDTSITSTFSTMLSLEPVAKEIDLPFKESSFISSIGIIGMISGTVSICITKKNAAKIVSKMLGMEIEEESADAQDGIGEIINIITGGLKSGSAAKEIAFDIGIPTTVSGSNLSVNLLDGLEHIMKSHACEDIEFVSVLTYKKTS